jgi:hypothetical protein
MIQRGASIRGEVSNQERPLGRKIGRIDKCESIKSRLSSPIWGDFSVELVGDCAFFRVKLPSHLHLKLAEMFVCPREFASRIV